MNNLDTILKQINGRCDVIGRRDRAVGSIRYDSRRVAPGDIYVAINGRDDRAIEFVPQAIDAGASVVVTDNPERLQSVVGSDRVTVVLVDDARLAMAEMAHAMAGYPDRRLKIYGVTGTNGKTTVSWVLQQMLQACGERVGVIGTLGVMIGTLRSTGFTTPESPELADIFVEMVAAGVTAVVMEVSSHALTLGRVHCIRFSGAVFTNLTQDHLDFHSTMQEYRDAKKRLFDKLDTHVPAVVNIDDIHGEWMVRDSHALACRYGTGDGADARIGALELRPGNSRWEVTFSDSLGGGVCTPDSPLAGAFNVYNVTSALALCLALGYDQHLLLGAIGTLRSVPGRMESVSLVSGATAVIDYAHTPDALANVLEALRRVAPAGSHITAVFGCGGDRDRSKRPMMGEVASRLADSLVVTSDNPRSELPDAIIDQIVDGVNATTQMLRIPDRKLAIITALEAAQLGDIVLVAGKGHEEYQIVGSESRHFSDREVIDGWNVRGVTLRSPGVAAA